MKTITIRIEEEVYQVLKNQALREDRTIKAQLRRIVLGKQNTSNKETHKKSIRFKPPDRTEVWNYIQENKYCVDIDQWFNHYEANGWLISGRSKMQDWKASIRYWHNNNKDKPVSEGGEKKEVYVPARDLVNNEPIDKESFYARSLKEAEESRKAPPKSPEDQRKGRVKLLKDVILGNKDNHEDTK